jgi:hypothetical protein
MYMILYYIKLQWLLFIVHLKAIWSTELITSSCIAPRLSIIDFLTGKFTLARFIVVSDHGCLIHS